MPTDILHFTDRIARPSPQTRAFTLIELLVVVSVIALLAAILVPALNQARNSAKIVVCANNQRQIAIAWNVYLSSNDSAFPRWRQNIQWLYGGKEPPVVASTQGHALPYRPLNPYVALRETDEQWARIFKCPGDRPIVNAAGEFAITKGNTTYDYFGNSYLMNWLLLLPYDMKKEYYVLGTTFRLDDVELPFDRVVLLGDCQWYYTTNRGYWNYDAQFHSPKDWMNLAFLDGHVSFTHVYSSEELDAGATAEYDIVPYRQ